MSILPQIVLSGLAQGSLYALAALGIVLIFNAGGIVNFAQGAMAVVTAYATWGLLNGAHVPYPLAVALALGAAFALGVATEMLVLRRVADAPPLTQIVVTLGLLMLLTGLVGIVFGHDPRSLPELVTLPSISLGSLILVPSEGFDLAVLIVLVAALMLLLRRTKLGLGMRALSQDRFAARLAGISLTRVLSLTWGIGVALAGAAGILAVPSTTLTPATMDTLVIYGFVAAVFGGFGTLSGAIVGGLLLGVVDNLIKTYLAPELSLSVVFALLLLALYVRPNGLFGRAVVRKV
ncbi:MAG: Branched-chain amino acid transporter permease [Candidatus Eremiobacteraeota bacterium]|nr:Branched-chain amino acid transporter permease [Candidatus Eremiobacteraeota bacterium]